MSKTPNFDAKLQTILDGLEPGERTCEMTGETWVMDEEEISWYRKLKVPPSRLCPKARLWHNAAFYTVFQWWWNPHPEGGKPVLSYVHPGSGVKVLPDEEWYTKDFSDQGINADVSVPFFSQFEKLWYEVPANATRNTVPVEKSVATTSLGDTNSYFVAACSSKNSAYLIDCIDTESSLEGSAGIAVSDSFHFSHSSRLHGCQFAYESYDCMKSRFIFDCRNCENCFGATNKRNAKYVFFNEQLSKEEYEKRVADIDLGDAAVLAEYKERWYQLIREAVWPENFNVSTTDSTGDYLIKCSNCQDCSFGLNSHDCYQCYGIYNANECMSSTAVPGQRCYQCCMAIESSDCSFCIQVARCDDVQYSFNCYDCAHCFGCVGLRNKKFCIFNKQYTEEEYWQKLDELKSAMLERGEYGSPIPMSLSFSYYPESGPVTYLGAQDREWDMLGLKTFSIDANGAFGASRTEGKEIIPADQVPQHIDDLTDDWVGKLIMDPDIQRPFTFLKPEIAFYRKHRLAPPRKHFTSRIKDLMWAMNTGLFEEVSCDKCQKPLKVATNRTFPDRKIYCQKDYLAYLEQNG